MNWNWLILQVENKKGLIMHQIYHNNIIRCLWLNCRKRASNTLRQVVHAGNISSILQITQILTIVYSSIIIFTCTLMVPFLKLFLPFIYYAFVKSIFLTPSSFIFLLRNHVKIITRRLFYGVTVKPSSRMNGGDYLENYCVHNFVFEHV